MAALRNALAVRETLLYAENRTDLQNNDTVSLVPCWIFPLVKQNNKRKKRTCHFQDLLIQQFFVMSHR